MKYRCDELSTEDKLALHEEANELATPVAPCLVAHTSCLTRLITAYNGNAVADALQHAQHR